MCTVLILITFSIITLDYGKSGQVATCANVQKVQMCKTDGINLMGMEATHPESL